MKDNKNMIFYLVLTLIYIFPLILANVYYLDDMHRAMAGYGWSDSYDGRILSTLLMQMLSLNTTIGNLFPYPTILSALIFTTSGYFTCKISGIEDQKKIKICSFIPLVSPFILQNLSFRYDCLPMSISVIACIIPFLFFSNQYIFIILSIIGLLVSAFTYQSSISIYPMLCIIKSIRDLIDNKHQEVIKNIFLSIVSFFIFLLMFKIIQILFSIQIDESRSDLVFSTSNPFELIKNNIRLVKNTVSILNYGITKFNVYGLSTLTFLSVILFLFSPVKIINKLILIFLLFGLPVISILIPLLLKNTNVSPRVLIGISFIPYGFLIFISRLSNKMCTYIGTFIFLTALPIMSTYSNALLSQNKYELEMARRIFNKIDIKDQNIVVDGIIPESSEVKIAKKNFPFLNSIIPQHFAEFRIGLLLNLNGIISNGRHLPTHEESQSARNKKCLIPIIDTHHHYIIRSDSKNIVIDFKKEKCD
ncbi:glucosyltransferase domain-containing protein [Candidatus Williamhamiltonella defendens]|uniref:glucosyltransferase domain-containing protein n=1 Tax=Candidatus Williamhamiltonella defendens TaxID=138072 RepID=UPI00030DE9E1|nr:glucosyltransferase domain-containing protein [Candidatus Hamiltonella defensa]